MTEPRRYLRTIDLNPSLLAAVDAMPKGQREAFLWAGRHWRNTGQVAPGFRNLETGGLREEDLHALAKAGLLEDKGDRYWRFTASGELHRDAVIERERAQG